MPAATSSCPATRPSDPRGGKPRTGQAARPDAHHQRRHDAAGGRRQGGRGRHHGDGRLAHRASGDPRTGRVRLCFTCDEEIGRGVDQLDLAEIGAAACYTLDGHGSDKIDVETFSADLAVVTVRGVNIHPSIAKGRMINAVRAAADFSPGCRGTASRRKRPTDREGFLHPYEIGGGVGEVKLQHPAAGFRRRRARRSGRTLREAAARGQ